MIRTLDARTLGVDAIVAALDRPASQIPGGVSEAVDAILFLAAGGGYVTGEVLRVDGGRALA